MYVIHLSPHYLSVLITAMNPQVTDRRIRATTVSYEGLSKELDKKMFPSDLRKLSEKRQPISTLYSNPLGQTKTLSEKWP